MAVREFLVIEGGVSVASGRRAEGVSDATTHKDPEQVRYLPLSHDVIDAFVVMHPIPSLEPVQHPLMASRTISLMPDGRYVLAEISGAAGAVIGEPVRLSEAIDVAHKVLARAGDGEPLDAQTLAVAYLGLLSSHMQPPPSVWPSARSGA